MQGAFNCQPVYEECVVLEPSSYPKSVVLVKNGSQTVGKGTGATRKAAEEEAAKSALKYFSL